MGVAAAWSAVLGLSLVEDDFALIHDGLREGRRAVTKFFGREVTQFRPLTKGAYFVVMGRLFGAEPLPYHLVSLGLHLLNTVLVSRVLLRLGLGGTGALVGAALFGLTTSSFTSLAWACCIQWLLPTALCLAATLWTLDGLRSERLALRRGLAVALAFAVAVSGTESVVGMPGVLALLGLVRRGEAGPRRLLRVVGPVCLVLAAYLAFRLFWKSLPTSGVNQYEVGSHMLVNLAVYAGWGTQVATLVPEATSDDPWNAWLLVYVAVGAVLLVRRRWDVLLLGSAWFVAIHLPALGLRAHAYYHHTYLPGVGLFLMFGAVVEELLPRRWSTRPVQVGFVLAASALSFVLVRRNLTHGMEELPHLPANFVARHALQARNALDSIAASFDAARAPAAVQLVYEDSLDTPGARRRAVDVKAALGNGTALRLLFDDLELQAHFTTRGTDVRPIEPTWVYDASGRCRLVPFAEVESRDG